MIGEKETRVKLGADISEYVRKMDEAAQKTQAAVAEMTERVVKYGAAVAAASAAAAAALVKHNMGTIDALAKTADKIGETTEQLAGMRHAAELSGAGAATMDKALMNLSRKASEAAAGIGEARGVIKELGIDAAELARQSPAEQFRMIADALGPIENRADKVRIAFKLFEAEGVSLLNTMDMGREGINAAVNEADRLGLALSRIDAAKVEAANDAMTRAKAATEGVANTLTVALAPYIEAVTTKFIEAGVAADGWKDEILSGVKVAINGAARIADAWRGLELIWEGLKVAWEGLNLVFLKGLESLDKALTDTVNGAIESINGLIEGINNIPGIDLPTLEKSEYDQVLAEMVAEAETAFDRADAKWMQMATRPLPSDNVKEWLAEVEAAAQIAAEAVAKAKPGGTDYSSGTPAGTGAGAQEGEDPEILKQREKLAQQLTMIEESLLTQEERLQASYERRAEMVALAHEDGLIGEQRQFELLEKLYLAHQDALTKIHNKGLTDRQKFQALSLKDQVKDVVGALVQMTQATATQNKAMFAINKAASIATAIMNTAEGVTKTLAKYPGPLGIGLAAVHAAAGAAQVASIMSTNFGGASSVAPSVAATGATQVNQTVDPLTGPPEKAEPQQVTNYHIYGNVFDIDETARKLAPAMKKAEGDGIYR